MITILAALTTVAGCALGPVNFWGYWPAHIWAVRLTCIIFLMRVKVTGQEYIDPKQSYVFVCNHQGAYDIWSIYGYLNHNFKWLMKKPLEKIFLVGKACRKGGHVFVDDSSLAGIRETIAESERDAEGRHVARDLPEGSRTWDGNMGEFKRGSLPCLPPNFKLPVVPITIDGSFRAMPRYTYNMTPLCDPTENPPSPFFPGENGFNTRKPYE